MMISDPSRMGMKLLDLYFDTKNKNTYINKNHGLVKQIDPSLHFESKNTDIHVTFKIV